MTKKIYLETLKCPGSLYFPQLTALLKYLGFTIHEVKSTLKPTQQIEFLGFIIDSTKMTVTIRKDKMIAITNKIKKLMATKFPTIRRLAIVTGSVISLLPVVHLGIFSL